MKDFSEKYGYSKGREAIQLEDLDNPTRKRIWNLLGNFYTRGSYGKASEEDQNFLENIWDRHYKETIDHLKSLKKGQIYRHAREIVLSNHWYLVYDFIQATLRYYHEDSLIEWFIEKCNKVLEDEKCGYRILGKLITPITSPEEISEIDKSLEYPYTPISTHIEKALTLMSDRTNPDYPNSIKESISAVESLCNIIVRNPNSTLGQAIKKLEDAGVELHPALVKGFSNLYGWTNDEDGVRHAMMEMSTVDQDDARYMLVTCSAFVNYLIAESIKARIDLDTNYVTIRG